MDKDWKELAKLAAAETDPEKLLTIVQELNDALVESEDKLRDNKTSSRLLFVDDEENIRRTLPIILMKRGFEVQTAVNVPEALAKIRSNIFDVLISDLNISEEGDGLLVLREMHHAQPRCVNILLTGYPAFDSAIEAIHEGVDDYLVKPTDADLLVMVIKRKLEARRSRLRGVSPTP